MKTIIREEAKKIRDAIPMRTRKEKEKKILSYLKTLPLGKHVFIYKSMRSEVSTEEIIKWLLHSGAAVYLPRIDASDNSMQPHIFNPGDPLERSSFGMEEPVNEPLFELSLLSCVIIPLLAFDPQLQRLGYGGGFYDRFLPRTPEALRIGIAFSEQMVDRLEPLETDIPLDYIVTDSGIHSLI